MRPGSRGALALLAIVTATAFTVDPADAAPAPVADQPVIVVLANAPAGQAGTASRTNAVRQSQTPVTAELSGATDVHQLSVVDAVTATVTPQQEAALRANPNVAEVVPDAAIKVVPPVVQSPRPVTSGGAQIAPPPPGACAPDGKVQLDPEAVSAINADSDDPTAKTARSLGATGAGVTIGDIAGSIDVNSPELIRPNGQHVITDYQDFTGEGSATESEDIESFLDDGMMAAQSRQVYDLANYGAHPLAAPCRIRLEGVAPQVNLTAYKVYAANDITTTSAFLQAIDYAVNVDHVNVLNEEAGSFPMPDTSADLIKTANADAMAAGVTITVPSYDSGLTNTIWSPASQPGVISVGASTTYRSYAQSDQAGFGSIGATGWISDNISALSSGGSTEQDRSIDVVAPGDLDWAICTDNAQIAPDCLNDAGQQSGVTLSGGTSEAGPLVAGVAALVIQSYRATHGGASPAPALVDDLITGTADDLDVPGAQQGAGLVDAYRAVAAARSVHTSDGSPPGIGNGVIADTDQLDAVGNPGSSKKFDLSLANAGAGSETVDLSGRTLGTTRTVASASPNLTTSDPSYIDSNGNTRNYLKVPFTVPPGTSRLNGDIAWPSTNGSIVDLALLDPKGRLAGFTLPQGSGNHGHSDVRDPLPGTWTAVIASTEATPEGPIAGYQGVVHFEASVAADTSFGTVSPRTVTIAPGHSAKVAVTATLPGSPGDASASLVLNTRGGPASSIPLTLRSLIPVNGGVGHFTADLRGGNGRGGTPSQTFFYNLDVPAGKPALDVSTMLAGDNTDPYYAYLIDPSGEVRSQASNQLVVGQNNGTPTTVGGPGMNLHTVDPIAGRWTVLITFTNPVTGNLQSTPLTGTVSFAPVDAKVTGLPNGGTLPAGRSQVVAVTVHNTTTAPESYFLDARLSTSASIPLTSITPSQNLTLPLPVGVEYPPITLPQWIVPTDTTDVLATASSTASVIFDTQPFNGEPDLGSIANGNTASAELSAPDITPGDWQITPQPAGPGGVDGVPKSTASFGMTVTTAAFDPTAQSPNGDLWRSTTGFAPVVVQPGQATTLYLTITPSAPSGTLVSGTLYLDDSSALTQYGLSPSGSQLVGLPYKYTVG
jgi:hypothetical protein